ncbi:MAG: hypothetical protein IKN27_01600 [Selenomonadaceae bacterium]|nr:hypothetical protein [Selenomonadaceae bacterium]
MARQRKPKEDFETIPQAPRYEINSMGILRNRETKRILKWQVHEHGHKFMALWTDTGKVGVSQCSLLWLLHGKIKHKKPPVQTVISKGTRTFHFDSLLQAATFLASVTSLSFAGVRYHFRHRHNKIAEWYIRYRG